jgi:hypothetical protein
MSIFDANSVSSYVGGKTILDYINFKYPNSNEFDRKSFALLVDYLISGDYKGTREFANYLKERRAEAIVTAWGTAYLQTMVHAEAAGIFSTEKALAFLEEFYFKWEDEAIINLANLLPSAVTGRMLALMLKYKEDVSGLLTTVGSFLNKKATTGDLRTIYRRFVPSSAPKYQN